MGINRFKKNKSIGRRMIYTFVFIILIMSLGFVYSIHIKNNVSLEYDEFMRTNIQLSNLSVELSNSWNYFDMYTKTDNMDYEYKYAEANKKISDIMNEIEPYIQNDEESGIYLRSLEDMYDWYEQESEAMLQNKKPDEETYNKLMELKTQVMYIDSDSEMLTMSYLNYANLEYSQTLAHYKNADMQIYAIIIGMIVLSLLFMSIVSRDIIATLRELSKSARRLSDADWETPDINEQTYVELNGVARAFNNMKKSIKSFIEELNKKAELENNYNKEKLKSAEKDKLIRETQLKALQMQMNPHFLFNTLNTVGRMAMFEGADDTVRLIEAVSKILRCNLNYKDKLVRLKEEIEMIKAYVLIQQTRFQDQMTFTFNIDKDVENINLPAMTIQPIIENAIIHGLKESDSGGVVNISARREGAFVNISIEDNGKGISQEKITKILNGEGIGEDNEDKVSLGLTNIIKRLELYFGSDDLFNIQSNLGYGTVVTFLIPVKEGE